MDERNELSAILIIEAEPCVYSQRCVRCDKVFIPKHDTPKGTASYYRCPDCLTTKTLLRDLYSSTCAIS